MTLTEFLLARIAEEEEFIDRERWLYEACGLDSEARKFFAAQWDASFVGATSRFSIAVRNVGRALAYSFRPADARRRALPYADHPDYREEWRP